MTKRAKRIAHREVSVRTGPGREVDIVKTTKVFFSKTMVEEGGGYAFNVREESQLGTASRAVQSQKRLTGHKKEEAGEKSTWWENADREESVGPGAAVGNSEVSEAPEGC